MGNIRHGKSQSRGGVRVMDAALLLTALTLISWPASAWAFDCIAGETLQGDSCVPCSAGTFKAIPGNQSCTSCTSGASSNEGATSCFCLAGYTGDGSTCTACVAGTFKTTSGDQSCTSCTSGASSNEGATSCFCLAGYTGDGSTCTACVAGTFKGAPGPATCSACPADTYSTIVNATASNVCLACVDNSAAPGASDSPLDCICSVGYTGDGASSCDACIAGTYKDTTGSAACTECGVNTYSVTVAANTSSTCLSCDTNAVSLAGSGSPLDCTCNQGFQGSGLSCTACPPGSYNTGVNQSCSLCPADTYCPGGGSAPVTCPRNALSPVGSDAYEDCYCVDGYSWYEGGTICVPCVEDTFCKYGTLNYCPENSASPAESSVNTSCKCNVGYSGVDGGTCTICAAGSYKDTSGDASCTLCPKGTYSSFVGASESSFCLPCTPSSDSHAGSTVATDCKCNAGYSGSDGGPCLICQAGLYKEGNGSASCQQCGIGTYSSTTGATTSTTCTSCPANSITSLGAIYSFQCSCDIGYTGTPGSCSLCGAGYYKDVAGSAGCAKCPVGTYLTTTGGTSLSDCVACPGNSTSSKASTALTDCVCEAGYTGSNGGPCTACGIAEYKEDIGNAGCTPCPQSTYGSSTGATACTNCPDQNQDSPLGSGSSLACKCNDGYNGPNGGTCVACAAGTYWVYGTLEGTCINCVGGKYHYDTAVVGDQCFDCPVNTDTASDATDDITGCTCNAGYTGPDGKACIGCPAGSYKDVTGSAACTLCGVNTYSTVVSATSSSTCQACDSNAQSPAGSNEAVACTCNAGYTGPDGGTCTQCTAGTYKPTKGPYSCAFCQPGKYSTALGATDVSTCVDCKANSNSAEGASSASDCTCNMGYTLSGADCVECAAGTYKSAQGDQSCTSCPTHASTTGTGSVDIEQCICGDGYYGDLGGVCSSCPANWFCAGGKANLCPYYTVSGTLSSAVTDCTCQPGYYSASGNAPCQLCPRNSYCPGGSVITACPGGTPVSGFGSSSSSDCGTGGGGGGGCASGTYSNGVSCVTCPANSYCPGGSDPPSACPSNSASVPGMPTADVCQCNSGYYGAPGSSCAECEANSYCTGSRKYPCPLNSESASLSGDVLSCSCPTAYAGADGEACIPCQAGSWCDGGNSTDCHDDSDSPALSSAVTACTCNAGFTGDDGVDPCTGCIHGTYKTTTGDATCTQCPAGTWSWLTEATSDVTCVDCPLNSDSGAGSYEITQCTCNAGYTGSDGGPCANCEGGTWKSAQGSAECTECVAGKYSTTLAAIDLSTCLDCPTNSNSSAKSDSILKCTCNPGATGPDGTACALCSAGTYKSTQGSMECTKCPFDTYSTATGQTSDATCQACAAHTTSPKGSSVDTQCVCKKGHTGADGGPCTPCDAGYYKSVTGSSSCIQCPAGKYSDAASSKCNRCPANSYSTVPAAGLTACKCNVGYTGPDGGTCTLCAAGTYKSTTGSAACTPCPADTWAFSSSIGATDSSVCNSCAQSSSSDPGSVGFTTCKCNMGYTGSDGAPCPPCPAGSYKDSMGSAACTGCQAGTWSDTVAATVDSTCTTCHGNSTSNYFSSVQTACMCIEGHTGANGGPTCPYCAAGSWKSWIGGQSCQLCKAGKYSVTEGATDNTVCTDCPTNTDSDAGTQNIDGCKADRGYYMSGSTPFYTSPTYATPTECVVGTYKPENKNNSWCTPCFEGSTTVSTGSISVSQCICNIGHTRSGNACPQCAVGKYKTIIGPTSCLSCPQYTSSVAGSYALTQCVCILGYTGPDGQECTACGLGTYKDVIGSSACTNCPVNTYSTSTAATSIGTCDDCDPNAQSPAGSQADTACQCNMGYTGPKGGTCTACSAGKYKTSVGTASCTNCGVGKYSGASAAVAESTCQDCPEFMTTSGSGKDAINDCLCNKGYTGSNGGPCTICGIGTYKSSIGPSSCTNCPEGTYSGGTGLTAESQCTECPANYWSSAGSTSIGDCWEILFTTASIGQTQPLARGSNTLIVTLVTNLNFPESKSTAITITGLNGATATSSVSLSTVSGGNNAATILGSSGTFSSGSLTLTIADGQTLNAFTTYIFSFPVTNGASAQSSPSISIQASGRISTAIMSTTTGSSTVIRGVADGSNPLLIFVPEFDQGTIFQTVPLASGSNILNVSMRATSDIASGSRITLRGLTDSLTASTSSLSVTTSNGFTASSAVWTQSIGRVVITLSSTLSKDTAYSMSFPLRNPALAKTAVTVTISASVETGSVDASVANFNLVPEDYTILAIASGSKPFTIVVPTFTTAQIAQSYPVADADTVITVTFRANCDMPADSMVTITGLTGTQTSDVPDPGSASLTLTSVGSVFDTTPAWTQSTGTLVFSALSALSTSSSDFVVSFTLRNPASAHSSPAIALSGWIETGSFDSPFSQKIMTKPGATIFGVEGGSDPLYCVVPTFTTRIVTQSNPLAFAGNNITVTLGANINLAASDSSTITLSGFTGMTAPTTYVALEDYSINGTASDNIFSNGSAVGYGVYRGENLTITLAPGKTLEAGLWYIFFFRLVNPDNIQDAPNITIEARGTAPFLPNVVASSMEELLGQEGGALPARIVCPSGYYAPAGNPTATCTPCWPGSYSLAVGTMDSSTCSICPMNSYSVAASNELTDCTCNKGFTGPNGNPCTACPVGNYKDVQGSAFCTMCPADTYVDYTNATSVDNCTLCDPNAQSPQGSDELQDCECNAGWLGGLGGPCTACIAGTYKTAKGTGACINCPEDTYSTTLNATDPATCLACPANSVAPEGSDELTDCRCMPGYTGPNGGPCVQCAAGLWKDWVGPEACTRCPEGTYSGSTGLTAESQCTDCPANFWSGWGMTQVSDCWEIFFTTADIGQSQPLAGGANTLTFTLATNVDIPSAKSTGITISGLKGAIAPATVSLLAVDGGNSADVLFGSSATFGAECLTLQVASGQRLLNATDYIFSIDIQNPPADQDMPDMYINSTGRISSALNQTRVGPETTIRGVASGSLPLNILVPKFDDRTVRQSFPLTYASNTFTVTITPNCDVEATSTVTILGLTDTLTYDTYSLGVTSTNNAFEANGQWLRTTGSLIMTVASQMTGGTQYIVTFTLRNPSAGQSAVALTVKGFIETGVIDAPIAEEAMIPQIYSVLGVENGSMPLTIVQAAWTVHKIGSSYPVADADTVITVTLRTNVDITEDTKVTLVGLTGTQTSDSLGLGASTDLILYANVGFSAFYNRPTFLQSSGTLTFTSRKELPTKTYEYYVFFTLRNPIAGQEAVDVTMYGMIEAGTYDAPITSSVLTRPETTVYGVAGGGNPLYSIIPTFTTRFLRQSNPLAFAANNISVTLECNVELKHYEASVITITGLSNLNGAASSSVLLQDFTIGGNSSTSIFSDGVTQGYGSLVGGTLTLTLAPGTVMQTGIAYTFWFQVTNPDHIQPFPEIKIEASGTAPYLPAIVSVDNSPLLGTVGWARPGTIVCPEGFYAPAGSDTATCTQCAVGTYSAAVGTMGISTCNSCPANSNSPAASTLITDCTCNKGYTGPGATQCSACPAGKYKDTQGAAECSSCPRKTYSTTVAAEASSTCLSCPANTDSPVASGLLTKCICNAGYTGADGMTCNECPVGTYKPVNGSSPCTRCAEGTYSGSIAAVEPSTCLTCPAGTDSPEASSVLTHCTCKLGYTATQNGVVCTACEPGSFKPTRGVAQCTSCVPGKYSEASAAVSISTCLSCPANTYAPARSGLLTKCTCNPGYTGADGTACTVCPTGSYKSFTGDGVCTNCVAGKYSTQPAAVSHTYCQSCPQYANSPAGSSSSDACVCQDGYYGPGLGPCLPCEEGAWCSKGSKNLCGVNSNAPAQSGSHSSCTCNAGYSPSSTDSPCTACPVNEYKESWDNATCDACPANSVSERTASDSHFLCGCKPGFYGALGEPCTQCPAGSYCDRGIKIACPVFTTSTVGASLATQCHAMPGYTCDSGEPCDLCPVDHYCPGGPQVNSFACPQGTTAPQGMSSLSSCQNDPEECSDPNAEKPFGGACSCRRGYYGDVPAGDACLLCPAAFYCPGGNTKVACPAFATSANGSSFSANCVCEPGYALSGASCIVCPAGKWCYGGAINSCPENTNSPAKSTKSTDCVPLRGYCAQPGYPFRPGAMGTYCDADGTVRTCPAPTTQSPAMSWTVKNCTAPNGATETTPAPNTTNSSQDRATESSCGSGACSVGNYRTACVDGVGGECTACTNAPENTVYTSGGEQNANDCSWICSANYALKDGKCVMAGDVNEEEDVVVEFEYDGTEDDFNNNKDKIKQDIANAAGVNVDDIISLNGVLVGGKMRVTAVIRAPRAGSATLCDGLNSDSTLSASISVVTCSTAGATPAPSETPLPDPGFDILSPVYLAAIAAGGAGVLLGISAGAYSLMRRQKTSKIMDSYKAPTGLQIEDVDDEDLPTVSNAWANDDGSNVDVGGVFMQYKRANVLQNPFLASDGYTGNTTKPIDAYSDVSVEDYEEEF